jgi:hypothetical protein
MNLIIIFLGLYTLGNIVQVVSTFWLSKMSDKSATNWDTSRDIHDFVVYLILGFSNCNDQQKNQNLNVITNVLNFNSRLDVIRR